MAGAPGAVPPRLDSLAAFITREGHACPPSKHRESGFPLGRWVLAQRRLHRSGKLPVTEADLLNALPGWVWDWREGRWAQFLTALRDFAAREGHLRVPQSHRERSYPLGQKVTATRMLYSNGKLARERVQQLEQLPGWVWRGGPPVS
ncbi:MAG TPA: helicase associated domain-containing protein [Streptosporangiaceae bacterium]